jgi:RNA polymerase sigma factor for flagellar operon FliA
MTWQAPAGLGAAQGDEELRMLWRRYKAHNDSVARDRLILTFAPLVKYVAGRMSSALPSHVEETDLISYGLLGLIGAVERFEPERQVKFETYAVTRIKGSIIDELRALDWVPRSVRARAREIERKSAELEHRLQRAPTDDELSTALGMTLDEFQSAISQISNSSIVALDEMWSVTAGGEPLSLIDTIGDNRMTDPAALLDITELRDTLADAIARLPEREKIVVALYYYDGLTLREIGDVLGVTESRVSQLHTKAILRLKGRLQEERGGE